MANATKSNSLYRYTSIPALLDTLLNKKLGLSDPDYWKDKGDAYFLKEYAKNKNVRAICLFKKPESNLFWENYAPNGCMLEFDAKKLLRMVPKKSGFKYNDVGYVKNLHQENVRKKFSAAKLPFIKQHRYRDEFEYRIIWVGEEPKASIPIDFSCIKRISISGDVKEDIAKSLKELIQKIIGDKFVKKIPIIHSQIFGIKKNR